MENIRKTQIKLVEMKTTVSDLNVISSRLDTAEGKTNELKDIVTESIQNETQREK